MAWIAPVINRESAQTKTSCDDFNRICENLNISMGVSLKADWTVNDIVDETNWNKLIKIAQAGDESITDSTFFTNLNKIENVALEAHSKSMYPGTTLYPSDTLLL